MSVCYTSYMNNKTREQEYIEIVEQIKELEEKKNKLNQEIVEKMNQLGQTNIDTDKGSFVLAWRKKWEYSNDTQHLEVELKEAKKREENNGTAVRQEDTEYLRFISKKENVD